MKIYETKSMYESAFIVQSGIKPLAKKQEGRRWVIAFPIEAKEVGQRYYQNESLRTFVDCYQSVKDYAFGRVMAL